VPPGEPAAAGVHDVVVIGGGLAGIAATVALKQRGVNVLLLEAEAEPGGKLRATSAGVPRGPLVWEARRTAVTSLVKQLGLQHELVAVGPRSRARYVVRDGRLCGLEPSPRALLTTPALSFADRAALAWEALRPRARRRFGGTDVDDDESVAAFLRRRFGRSIAERLGLAMVNGIWAGDAERLSVAACFPELVALERTHGSVVRGLLHRARAPRDARALPPPRGTWTLRGGLAQIGRAAMTSLSVRTGARVVGIDAPTPGPVGLTLADGVRLQARAVVVATEAPAAARLVHALDPTLATALGGIEYAPLAVVHWREKSPASARLPPGFGWLAPPRERTFALGTLFVTDLVGGNDDDDGRRRFASFCGGVLAPGTAGADDATLVRGLTDELRALTGGTWGDVLHVERQPRAVAQPTLGHGGVVAQLRERTAQGPLVLAGSYLGAGAMRCAVESGFAAALDVVARLPARRVADPVTTVVVAPAPALASPSTTSASTMSASTMSASMMSTSMMSTSMMSASTMSASTTTVDEPVAGSAAKPRPLAGIEPDARHGDATVSLTSGRVDEPGDELAEIAAALDDLDGDRALQEVPLIVVGASYRDVPTEVRARLAAGEQGDDAASRALLTAGYADGVVVLPTCSRVEWIVSTSRPQWSADLLASALRTRVPEARLHVRKGRAAVHYLLRVAMGLDSVAEGEPAVGRQLVLAFEQAHREGTTDWALRQTWRATQQLLGERRRRGIVRHGLGVQTLVVQALEQRAVARDAAVAVLGQGEIGRAVVAALTSAGFTDVAAFRRDTRAAFDARTAGCAAVVVCTGAPAAHVALPTRGDAPIVVDVGVPAQVTAAPGWTSVSLEDLLSHPRRLLDDETRTWLVQAVRRAAERLAHALATPAPTGTLGAIDEERRVFLRETLPPLLERLPPPHADEVRRACAAFAHALIERVRSEGRP
jgi:oxygen-dependent protoporphyrinogen oxidase